jgi:hypothetical protein
MLYKHSYLIVDGFPTQRAASERSDTRTDITKTEMFTGNQDNSVFLFETDDAGTQAP